MKFPKRLIDKLITSRKENNFRTLSVKSNLIDFSSNDYLGLARNEELKNYSLSNKYKIGSTGSRLLSGNSQLALDTEIYLANNFKAEGSLIFNSGYNANLAILSSIPQRNDTIIYDELSHSSIKDGARLSFAHKISFKHNSINDLDKKLTNASGEKFVVVESAYSMDGDICPLVKIIALCNRHNAHIILDEAHCTGIYGEHGGGLSEELGVENEIFCRVLTFGKAIGFHGAAVLGCKNLIDYLINYARPFIYTTAMPEASYAIINKIFDMIKQMHSSKENLFKNIEVYNRLFDTHLEGKFNRVESHHPIQTIILPGNDHVKNVSITLQKSGFDVRPILSPTVREGSERLRICLHSFNTSDEISGLVHSLEEL